MNNILLFGLIAVVLYYFFFRKSEGFTDVEKEAFVNKMLDLFKYLDKEQVGYGTYVVKLKDLNNPYSKLDSLDVFFELNKAQKAGLLTKEMIMKHMN
jgi:hypothetical protein